MWKDIEYRDMRVAGSFVGRVINKHAGGDPHLGGRILYRAFTRGARDVYRWVAAGCKQGYARDPVDDEITRPEKVREWVEVHIRQG